jgi:hypothetical protein
MQFHRVSETVNADRWLRLGDLPGDKPLINGDGRIVKAYSREDVHAAAPCILCNSAMRSHGWIDPPAPAVPAEIASLPVDPVSGKQMEPVVVVPTSFPKTFAKADGKSGSYPDRVAHNDEEEKQALADGYHFVKPVHAAPAKKQSSKPEALDPDRGDLKGLVVCPGDWIVTHPSGERTTVKPDRFPLEYTKVF